MIRFSYETYKKRKKIQTVGKYIVCLLIIEAIIIISNFIAVMNHNKALTSTEVLAITGNYTQDETSTSNFKVEVTKQDKNSYYIKVNCKDQNVVVYVADEDGQYTIPIKKMICSTGKSTPTQGVYGVSDRYEWRYLVGNVYGQYATRITGQILFHSVPYTKKDKSSLEYWEYDKLGQPVSLGCVRLTVEDAKWIYDNCKSGTKVEFCSNEESDNRLTYAEPKQISGVEKELRGWDPTDPDKNNPWNEYKEIE